MMQKLLEQLAATPVAYIARDIERALGLTLPTRGYCIVSNATAFAKKIANGSDDALLIPSEHPLDTEELLRHELTMPFLRKHGIRRVVVFKNTSHIERAASALGLELLNPPADISKIVEEKISQVRWLGELATYLPPHTITTCKKLEWTGTDVIVQFNHAHTGDGTLRLTSKETMRALAEQFPDRDVRVMDVVNGPTFTNNNVVARDAVLFGNVNYQITGLTPFTDRPFATVGNDWGLAERLLPESARATYTEMVATIGNQLRQSGWRGLFGVDVMYDEDKKKLFLIEINARQPASATFESQLQHSHRLSAKSPAHCGTPPEGGGQKSRTLRDPARGRWLKAITIFEAHLAALLDLPLGDKTLVTIHDGAQLVRRIRDDESKMTDISEKIEKLKAAGLTVMRYDNTEPGQDVLRIQSERSLMESHHKLNERGRLIQSMVS